MRVVVVYRDSTDYARAVTDFLRDFEHQTGHTIELVDPDTTDGAQFCSVYSIMEYPSMIALSDDGIMQQMWKGMPLPTISEVSYYVQQN